MTGTAANLSIFDHYPEMPAEDQGYNANALLGLLMEKEILFQPSMAELVGDDYAGYWLSWFANKCPYGQSVALSDQEILDAFGFTLNRWQAVRRLLKSLGFLVVGRKAGVNHYSLSEKYLSDEHRKIQNVHPAIPVDRITAAAMLDAGLKIDDVLLFSAIKQHLSIRDLITPDETEGSDYSVWQELDNDHRRNLSMFDDKALSASVNSLFHAGLLQVERIKALNTLRYRINYKVHAQLTYSYIHHETV